MATGKKQPDVFTCTAGCFFKHQQGTPDADYLGLRKGSS